MIDILIIFYIWIFSKIVYILVIEKILALDLKNEESILKISKALANPGRLDILRLLSVKSLSIYEISKNLILQSLVFVQILQY